MLFGLSKKGTMVSPQDALPGRNKPMPNTAAHALSGVPLNSEVPDGFEQAIFGMGCFWGVERKFWQTPGVWLTMVGYAGGYTPNPTYEEVCSGQTGHNEVVRVIYDPEEVSYADLLKVFWEGHDPTQGMAQGNDRGTQYRSAIYTFGEAQKAAAEASREAMTPRLKEAGYGAPTTEIVDTPAFYFAEDYHQQYLAKNPRGYCGLGGTGVTCPIGIGVSA